MSIEQTAPTLRGHIHFNRISQIATADNKGGILSANLDLAIRHLHTDAEVYKNAARNSIHQDQKILFLKLVCLKEEGFQKLKRQRVDSSSLIYKQDQQTEDSWDSYVHNVAFGPLPTIYDALNFAMQRESIKLAFYEKQDKGIHLSSVCALFEFLIEAELSCMGFLMSQFSVLRVN